ncbi:MAG TPA: DUF1289 domain-containing protein [Burkholderiales bacterium]|nr:DUF1289 domain-containing protein [Burkholderiales bacterium]
MNSPLEQVPSPCVNVCQMDSETGYCRGCLRTIQEIAGWLDFTNEEKIAVLQRLEERRKSAA